MIYRWGSDDIEQWLTNYVELNPHSSIREGSQGRQLLKEAAIVAGTPGFLSECVEGAEINKFDGWERRASIKSKQWDVGEDRLIHH